MAFSMDVDYLDKTKVVQTLEVEPEVKTELQKQAECHVAELLATDINNSEGRRQVSTVIEKYGMDTMEKSAKANTVLSTRIVDLSRAGGEAGVVASSLDKLNGQLRVLDPSGIKFDERGLFGKIKNNTKQYFKKYEKADSVIKGILERLSEGRNVLKHDNTTLEIEQDNLQKSISILSKQVEMGNAMDSILEEEIAKLRTVGMDEERAKFVEEDVLFPLRQRITDLQALQAVNYQSYFAMEVTRKNNLELIRAVDRVSMLTVTALRTAVMVAQSLENQKVVLQSVTAVKDTTNQIIASTSRMMKDQGTQIQQQASNAMIDPQVLQQAFEDVFTAMDDVSNYKSQALPQLKSVISEFKEMADEGAKRMKRIEAGIDVV